MVKDIPSLHLHSFLASCACNWSLGVSFQGFPEFQSFKSSSWLQRIDLIERWNSENNSKVVQIMWTDTPSSFGCHVRDPAPVLRSCESQANFTECTSVCRLSRSQALGDRRLLFWIVIGNFCHPAQQPKSLMRCYTMYVMIGASFIKSLQY